MHVLLGTEPVRGSTLIAPLERASARTPLRAAALEARQGDQRSGVAHQEIAAAEQTHFLSGLPAPTLPTRHGGAPAAALAHSLLSSQRNDAAPARPRASPQLDGSSLLRREVRRHARDPRPGLRSLRRANFPPTSYLVRKLPPYLETSTAQHCESTLVSRYADTRRRSRT